MLDEVYCSFLFGMLLFIVLLRFLLDFFNICWFIAIGVDIKEWTLTRILGVGTMICMFTMRVIGFDVSTSLVWGDQHLLLLISFSEVLIIGILVMDLFVVYNYLCWIPLESKSSEIMKVLVDWLYLSSSRVDTKCWMSYVVCFYLVFYCLLFIVLLRLFWLDLFNICCLMVIGVDIKRWTLVKILSSGTTSCTLTLWVVTFAFITSLVWEDQ